MTTRLKTPRPPFVTGKGARSFSSPSNLVAKLLAGDDGDLLTHPLVGVEVVSQPGVVFLDDDPGGLLHRLGPDSSLKDMVDKFINVQVTEQMSC